MPRISCQSSNEILHTDGPACDLSTHKQVKTRQEEFLPRARKWIMKAFEGIRKRIKISLIGRI